MDSNIFVKKKLTIKKQIIFKKFNKKFKKLS